MYVHVCIFILLTALIIHNRLCVVNNYILYNNPLNNNRYETISTLPMDLDECTI